MEVVGKACYAHTCHTTDLTAFKKKRGKKKKKHTHTHKVVFILSFGQSGRKSAPNHIYMYKSEHVKPSHESFRDIGAVLHVQSPSTQCLQHLNPHQSLPPLNVYSFRLPYFTYNSPSSPLHTPKPLHPTHLRFLLSFILTLSLFRFPILHQSSFLIRSPSNFLILLCWWPRIVKLKI